MRGHISTPLSGQRMDVGNDNSFAFSNTSSRTSRRQQTSSSFASPAPSATNRQHHRTPLRCVTSGVLSRKSKARHFVVAVTAAAALVFAALQWVWRIQGEMGIYYAVEDAAAIRAWNASLSVAVSHEAPLTSLDRFQKVMRFSGLASSTAMRRTQLPSWTMHVVEAECAECLDSATHAAAVARQLGNASAPTSGAAVFATPSAPLGLAGPMLFAMASVTDDVAVGAELSLWSWVGRSYGVRRHFAGASPAGVKGGTTPYLVVMGIPSTDQPIRASLRGAQHATWLSYRDVARSENDFNGALLPLYIFAAAEREVSQGVTDTSPLLPTVAEYEAASALLLPRHDDDDEIGGGDDDGTNVAATVPNYSERRVQLVSDMGHIAAGDARLAGSPCAQIVSVAVTGDGAADNSMWLSELASALSLPVRPAAVAPAAFICHASTALWQEALAHRNMLWVDMMTDRRPTSGKKIGQGGNWGLPVEVGMTQKLVLWLEYAYHAFPDVPYIMKSDDDTYLKVPQFVSDIRYIRAGYKGERVPTIANAPRDPAGIEETEECIYWGNKLRNTNWNRLRYHAGSGYMLHRRLVQVSLEMSDRRNAQVVQLAGTPFDARNRKRYIDLVMDIEDAFVGNLLRGRRQRIRDVCPFHAATYVEEDRMRHMDTHKGRNVEWATVLVHHCTPSDEYYLHYYFQHEHQVAERAGAFNKKIESKAKAAARRWMSTNVAANTTGRRVLPKARWTRTSKLVTSFISEGDNVSVYSVPYNTVKFKSLDKARFSNVPK